MAAVLENLQQQGFGQEDMVALFFASMNEHFTDMTVTEVDIPSVVH